jgi:hypothetical protein
MGYNARNNQIHDNITRMRRAWEAERDAWPLFAASMQGFPLKAMFGSGPKSPPQ